MEGSAGSEISILFSLEKFWTHKPFGKCHLIIGYMFDQNPRKKFGVCFHVTCFNRRLNYVSLLQNRQTPSLKNTNCRTTFSHSPLSIDYTISFHKLSFREMDKEPTRVIIKAQLRDIPAEIEQRVHCLGSDFCKQILGRPINIQVQGGYDAMLFLPGFDSAIQNNEKISRLFIHDFNVTGRLDKENSLELSINFTFSQEVETLGK